MVVQRALLSDRFILIPSLVSSAYFLFPSPRETNFLVAQSRRQSRCYVARRVDQAYAASRSERIASLEKSLTQSTC